MTSPLLVIIFYVVPVTTANDLDHIDQQLELVIRSAWAESTLATRNSQWKRYIQFCSARGLTVVPAEKLTIARFLVHLGTSCCYSTCNNYLSAVISLHKFTGFDCDARQNYVIRLVLLGLGRRLGKQVNQKIGLKPSDLYSIFLKLSFQDINVLTMWAALIMSFCTLLRKSNLVQDKLNDQGAVVMRHDIEFVSNGIILNVRKSKTIQRKEYVLKIPITYTSSNCFCAVSMLCSHLVRTQHIADGPLFYLYKKGKWRPLLYGELLEFLKNCVKLIGLDPSEVGLHSMRRSGASYLHDLGVSLVDIMCAGDWKSLAALQYLISPLSRKTEIDGMVSSKLSFFP